MGYQGYAPPQGYAPNMMSPGGMGYPSNMPPAAPATDLWGNPIQPTGFMGGWRS
jgi:hypothetical protein